MAVGKQYSEIHPFEFRLILHDKEQLRLKSLAAGVSMSEYLRRAINSYSEEMQIREFVEGINAHEQKV